MRGLTATVSRANDIQSEQTNGLNSMVNGLAANLKVCKESVNAVSIAQYSVLYCSVV